MLLFRGFFVLAYENFLAIGAASLIIRDIRMIHIIARNLPITSTHRKLLLVCMTAFGNGKGVKRPEQQDECEKE